MCVMKVKGDSDEKAIEMANSCEFALSSCVFSNNASRAKHIGSNLKAGMFASNDLEGTTYMSQSLPFGGRGKSGFGRFAGPEGLRGLCVLRSVCDDRFGFLRASIPAPLQYPSSGSGFQFATSLIKTFYGYGLKQKLSGVIGLLTSLLSSPKRPKSLSGKVE